MNTINLQPKKRGGSGGLWGSLFGGLAGVAAAPFTGGASLTAVPALMGAGGLIGGAIDKGSISQRSGPQPMNAAKLDPEVQFAQVADARKAVWEDPSLDATKRNELDSTLGQTQDQLKVQLDKMRRV